MWKRMIVKDVNIDVYAIDMGSLFNNLDRIITMLNNVKYIRIVRKLSDDEYMVEYTIKKFAFTRRLTSKLIIVKIPYWKIAVIDREINALHIIVTLKKNGYKVTVRLEVHSSQRIFGITRATKIGDEVLHVLSNYIKTSFKAEGKTEVSPEAISREIDFKSLKLLRNDFARKLVYARPIMEQKTWVVEGGLINLLRRFARDRVENGGPLYSVVDAGPKGRFMFVIRNGKIEAIVYEDGKNKMAGKDALRKAQHLKGPIKIMYLVESHRTYVF